MSWRIDRYSSAAADAELGTALGKLSTIVSCEAQVTLLMRAVSARVHLDALWWSALVEKIVESADGGALQIQWLRLHNLL